jgi:predicted 2-oxoglutarate/Fe(II)-dependent dioxygenase YbiX
MATIDEQIALTLFNLHDLIIIRNKVIPQEDINLLMECTNSTDTEQATILNDDPEGKKDLEVRDTLWYPQSDELRVHLEQAISGCYFRYVQPRYQCTFKAYEPAQFLGYNPGGHYKKHNDGEHFNEKTRQWEKCMPRDISFLFYLNEEYGGGELEFTDLGLTIKPKKGMMIAFPSYKDFAHKVHPVTWGHRYSLVSWIETEKNLYDTIPRPGF